VRPALGSGFRIVERWVTIERSEEPDRVAADRRHGPALDLIQPRSISASSERTITLDDDSPMTDGMTRPCGIHPQGEKRGTLRQWRLNRSNCVLRRRQQAGTSVDSRTGFNKRGERSWWRVVVRRVTKQPGPLGSNSSTLAGSAVQKIVMAVGSSAILIGSLADRRARRAREFALFLRLHVAANA